ncbi:C40 family peptidase [Kineococcus glutinatus]|uniref:NlpC/P60 domain-containing protein n=1 Tax=Kineococcus glutinatus TaxID=1070872 RepID=A0ABP9I4Q3_9ACTN
MSTRHPARHRASARPLTPLASASAAVRRNASTVGRGTAVLAATSGLVLSLSAPAGATPAEGAAAAPVATTAPAAVVTAPATTAPVVVESAFAAAPTPAPAVVEIPLVVEAPAASPAPAQAATDARGVEQASRSSQQPADLPVAAVTTPAVATTAVVATAPAVATTAAVATAPVVVQPVVAAAPVPAAPVALQQTPVIPLPPLPVDRGQQVLDTAAQYVGVPYVYGGTTPAGFDCSGYTQYVFRQIGVQLPRTSGEQARASRPVSAGEAQPGDLVFFSSGGRVYHVGIYAGGNEMYDAPRAGKPVSKRAIWSSAVSYGRVL